MKTGTKDSKELNGLNEVEESLIIKSWLNKISQKCSLSSQKTTFMFESFLVGNIRVIRKKSNILYFNFGCKYDLQIQIVAIFRKKDF